MTDLATLDTAQAAEDGVDVVLRHPGSGADLDVTIHVLGRDSKTFRQVESQQVKRAVERVRRAGRNAAPATPEEMEGNSIDLLAACTTGWTNVMLEGKSLEFSRENALMVYRRFPWIREQVDAAVGDRANFTKPPSAASLPSPNNSSD